MTYSVLLQAGFNNGISESISAVKKAGFKNVFLTLNSDITEKEIVEVVESGLLIDNLHLPYNEPYKFLNSLWMRDEETKKAIDILKRCIDIASHNSIGTVVIHASSSKKPPEMSAAGLANFYDLAEYCRTKNIVMAIENIKRIDYVEYLLTNLPLPNVKFCFDIGHANAFTKNLYSHNWDFLLRHLHCVHLHDNDGKSDLHLIPGMGNIKWDFVVPKLKGSKKDLILTAEVYYKGRESFYPNITEDEFYSKIYNSLKKIDRRY